MLNRVKLEMKSKNDQIAKLQNMNAIARSQINQLRKQLELTQINAKKNKRANQMGSF
jgi:hypothetical protein